MPSRQWLAGLLVVGLVAPIAIAVLVGLGRLLAMGGDATGGLVADRAALVVGTLWAIDLVVLVLWLAADSLARGNSPPPPDDHLTGE